MKFDFNICSVFRIDVQKRLYYNANHIGYGKERDLQMNPEILELYLSLTEPEKESVNQMIFSLLKNESCCQQEPCPQD